MSEQEKQELVEHCEKAIAAAEHNIEAFKKLGNDSHGVIALLSKEIKVYQITLASLKAEIAGYKWFHEGSPETRGWYADCYPLPEELLSQSDSISQYEPLYSAPTVEVSEIKMPQPLVEYKSGLFGHSPTLTLQTTDWADGYNEAIMDVKLLNELSQ